MNKIKIFLVMCFALISSDSFAAYIKTCPDGSSQLSTFSCPAKSYRPKSEINCELGIDFISIKPLENFVIPMNFEGSNEIKEPKPAFIVRENTRDDHFTVFNQGEKFLLKVQNEYYQEALNRMERLLKQCKPEIYQQHLTQIERNKSVFKLPVYEFEHDFQEIKVVKFLFYFLLILLFSVGAILFLNACFDKKE